MRGRPRQPGELWEYVQNGARLRDFVENEVSLEMLIDGRSYDKCSYAACVTHEAHPIARFEWSGEPLVVGQYSSQQWDRTLTCPCGQCSIGARSFNMRGRSSTLRHRISKATSDHTLHTNALRLRSSSPAKEKIISRSSGMVNTRCMTEPYNDGVRARVCMHIIEQSVQ